MERFVKGDLVVISYPSFDFKTTKKRPAVIIATTKRGAILCPITTKIISQIEQINLTNKDLSEGKLKVDSLIIPIWLMTFEYSRILYKLGSVNHSKLNELTEVVCKLIKQ